MDEVDMQAAVDDCAAVLAWGGIAVVPTDTVYGIAARADTREAVEAVFTVKGRDAGKALVVMAADEQAALRLAASPEGEAVSRLARLWPGPLTIVVKAAPLDWLQPVAPAGTLGIRVPASSFLLELLKRTGPLAVTSANLTGKPAPASFADIDPVFLGKLDSAVLIEGEAGSGKPSTVVEIAAGDLSVLRSGEIGDKELRSAWNSESNQ